MAREETPDETLDCDDSVVSSIHRDEQRPRTRPGFLLPVGNVDRTVLHHRLDDGVRVRKNDLERIPFAPECQAHAAVFAAEARAS